MGLVGYGLGWLVLRVTPDGGVESVMGLIVVAVALITRWFGSTESLLVHAVIASALALLPFLRVWLV